jgi:hypothetical protein
MVKLPMVVKLTGVSFGNAQENIKTFGCPDIRWFALFREPGNQHDPNAIRVALFGEFFMGYVPKEIARELAPMMDAGKEFDAEFVCVNKHPRHDIVGITVKIIEATPMAGAKNEFQKGGVENGA